MKTVFGKIQSVDILAIGVHPDDIELACCGTLLKHLEMGATVGVLDLTAGELGTRGSGPIRLRESAAAAELMKLSFRTNAGLKDGFFQNNVESQMVIIDLIRACRPAIILGNSLDDRHPDHGRAARLIADSFFYSGLSKISTAQDAFRANVLYHYIQDKHLIPDFCIDVSKHVDQKRAAIACFETQFFISKEEEADQPTTPISTLDFMEYIFANMRVFGRPINATYAEGFQVNRTLGITDLRSLS
jgi:bacillithiol biosynthesis deacetylase BshB1